jgi:putative spermidine/putrescine transport system permease protein
LNTVDIHRGWLQERRRLAFHAGIYVTPLLACVALLLLLPLAMMMLRSVRDPAIPRDLPRTVLQLKDWHAADGLPSELAFQSLAGELVTLLRERRIGDVALRLDFEVPGLGGLVTHTARELMAHPDHGQARAALLSIDSRWGSRETWAAFDRARHAFTTSYLARAFDYRYNASGDLALAEPGARPHTELFIRTMTLGVALSLGNLLLAYPLAFFIASRSARFGRWLLLLVLLPMWISVLVRVTSWIVLLQSQGVINDLLVAVGLLAPDRRIQLIYNLTGSVIVMSHMLLPTMILPLYTSMRQVPRALMRAAHSLGAGPVRAFFSVYLPATLPGIAVAGLFGFISTVGFFIVPALVGGSSGQMISTEIANYATNTMSYGLTAALGTVTLAMVALLYAIYARLTTQDVSITGTSGDLPIAIESVGAAHYGGGLGAAARGMYRAFCLCMLVLLVAPIFVIVPLSFSAHAFFSFTPEMLHLHPAAFSLRWYRSLFAEERWQVAFWNSLFVALAASAAATVIAALAAIGMNHPGMPIRRTVSTVMLVPAVAPIVVIASGMFMLFSKVGLVGSLTSVVIAHVALIAPGAVFMLTAATAAISPQLARGAASLGARPMRGFITAVLPLAAPGFVTAALFAFLGSFDETVVVQFLTFSPAQFTFPRQMFSGIRDEMTPTILAAGTLVLALCVVMFLAIELGRWLQRRRSRNWP